MEDAADVLVDDSGQLIQNAVRVRHTGEILVSKHQHDFIEFDSPYGPCAIDGGRAYMRRLGNPKAWDELAVSAALPTFLKAKQLVWGTRGIRGDEPLRFILLCEATTDHLKAILANGTPGEAHHRAIIHILKERDGSRNSSDASGVRRRPEARQRRVRGPLGDGE